MFQEISMLHVFHHLVYIIFQNEAWMYGRWPLKCDNFHYIACMTQQNWKHFPDIFVYIFVKDNLHFFYSNCTEVYPEGQQAISWIKTKWQMNICDISSHLMTLCWKWIYITWISNYSSENGWNIIIEPCSRYTCTWLYAEKSSCLYSHGINHCLSGQLWYLQHNCVGDTMVYH